MPRISATLAEDEMLAIHSGNTWILEQVGVVKIPM